MTEDELAPNDVQWAMVVMADHIHKLQTALELSARTIMIGTPPNDDHPMLDYISCAITGRDIPDELIEEVEFALEWLVNNVSDWCKDVDEDELSDGI